MSDLPDSRRLSLFGGWTQTTLPDGRVVWRQTLPRPPIRGLLGIDAMGPAGISPNKSDSARYPQRSVWDEGTFRLAAQTSSRPPSPTAKNPAEASQAKPQNASVKPPPEPAERAQLLPPDHPLPHPAQMEDGDIVVTGRRRSTT